MPASATEIPTIKESISFNSAAERRVLAPPVMSRISALLTAEDMRDPAGHGQTSKTRSEQHVTESAVLPSEIEQLPDLAGYLNIASSTSWRRVQISRP